MSCSIERPCSTSRCSSQPRAICKTGFKRERRWQNSATNELDSADSARAISATTMTSATDFSPPSPANVPPKVGQIAILAALGQPSGDALQIFDQSQAQHDRHGPELAQLQRRHLLIRGHESSSTSRHRSAHRRARSIPRRCHRRAEIQRRGHWPGGAIPGCILRGRWRRASWICSSIR